MILIKETHRIIPIPCASPHLLMVGIDPGWLASSPSQEKRIFFKAI